MLQLQLSFGNLIPNPLNTFLNLGYPLRTPILYNLLHPPLLCFHPICNIFLCHSLLLDLFEQPVDLSILGLDFGLRPCNLLSITHFFSIGLLLYGLKFLFANVEPLLFHFLSNQLHPTHKVPPQFILNLNHIGIRQKHRRLSSLHLLIIQIFL